MNATSTGWMLFIAAVGMMCTLLAVDITKLGRWNDAFQPAFVGLFMAHMGAVITAFIGGKIIPPDRDINSRERVSDSKLQELNK